MSLNKVMLIGNVGRDPDVRQRESGKVASFTLATTEKFKSRDGQSQEKTEWHNIVVWGNLADVVENYVRKGSQVYIEGKLQTRKYTDSQGNERYTTEVNVLSLQLLGRRDEQQQSVQRRPGDDGPL